MKKPKNREELMTEIKQLKSQNKRLNDTVDQLNGDLRLQTQKFKENEAQLKEEINYLVIQAKSTQTEEFKKLKDDNKILIEENKELKKQIKTLNKELEKCKHGISELLENEKKMKDQVSNEINELSELKKKYNSELEKINFQK